MKLVCLIENHAGHRFEQKANGVLEALEILAKRLGYKNNMDAGFKVVEINRVVLSDFDRLKNLDIALWEYKGNEHMDFWEWNSQRMKNMLNEERLLNESKEKLSTIVENAESLTGAEIIEQSKRIDKLVVLTVKKKLGK
jgi:hypothetical protein